MKKRWSGKSISPVLVLVMVLAALATSCGPGTEATGKIGVVVTVLPQAEFVERVGGDKVDITVMVPPGLDPHTYAPTFDQLKAVKQAKMYAKVGSGVEFELAHMGQIEAANENMLVVSCSQNVTLIDNDPHIWNSPLNAKIMVENICQGLTQVDPDNADFYTENRDSYLRELDVLDEYIHCKLDGFTNRAFMIYHPAFGYLARDYYLTQIPVEAEGKPPTLQLIQDCIHEAEQYHLRYLFVAPQFRTGGCDAIARAINGEIAPADPLPSHYIANMANIVDWLVLEFE